MSDNISREITKDEAIKILESMSDISTQGEALDMAIEALSQESSEDLISRQAAIDVADAVWSVTGDKNVAKVWDQIKDLPSAQPEITRCKDCEHWTNDDCPFAWGKVEDAFCSYAERRTDD